MLLTKLKAVTAGVAVVLAGFVGWAVVAADGPKPPAPPPAAAAAKPAAADDNILKNGGCEAGNKEPAHWTQGAEIDGVTYRWDKTTAKGGKASLCLEKTAKRYFPIAQWFQTIDRTGHKPALKVSAQVKADSVTKAILDVQFLDDKGEFQGHEWVAYIGVKEATDPPADHDWKEYAGRVTIPKGTKKLAVGLQIYGPGKVWFDDIRAEYTNAPVGKASGKPLARDELVGVWRGERGGVKVELAVRADGRARWAVEGPNPTGGRNHTEADLRAVDDGAAGGVDFHFPPRPGVEPPAGVVGRVVRGPGGTPVMTIPTATDRYPAIDDLPLEPVTATAGRQGGRAVTLPGGLGTYYEGLIVALLGSCRSESGEQKYVWEAALAGDHLRVSFPTPRRFAVSDEPGGVDADEIVVPISATRSPDHVLVRRGESYRAYAASKPEMGAYIQDNLKSLPAR